jgi:spore germination cell wall hydrolase CwlJ-like protein
MTNNLVKFLLVVAAVSPQAFASSHHHSSGKGRHTHHHRAHHHAVLPKDDVTCIANTAYREARNSDANMQAVANVVKNRLIAGWGNDYCHIIRDGRFVYSVADTDNDRYAKAMEVAEKVIQDELPDNTGGAVFFHSDRLRHRPRWAKPQHRTASIDGNVFYRDDS